MINRLAGFVLLALLLVLPGRQAVAADVEILCSPISGFSASAREVANVNTGNNYVLDSRGCVRVSDNNDKAWLLSQGFQNLSALISSSGTSVSNFSNGLFISVTDFDTEAGKSKVMDDITAVSGSYTFTSPTASFTTSDVGKTLYVAGAGITGGLYSGVILAVNSENSVTTDTAAATTPTPATQWGIVGKDDSQAFTDAVTAACSVGSTLGGVNNGGTTILIPPGNYIVNDIAVTACAVNWVGSGYHEGNLPNDGNGNRFWLGGTVLLHTDQSKHVFKMGNLNATISAPAVNNVHTQQNGTQFHNFHVFELHPKGISDTVDPPTWAPYVYPSVWSIEHAIGEIFLEHLFCAPCYEVLTMATEPQSSSGRLRMEGIHGDFFKNILRIHRVGDIGRFYDFHFWPFWSGTSKDIAQWKYANSIGVETSGASSLWFNAFFALGVKACFYFHVGDVVDNDPLNLLLTRSNQEFNIDASDCEGRYGLWFAKLNHQITVYTNQFEHWNLNNYCIGDASRHGVCDSTQLKALSDSTCVRIDPNLSIGVGVNLYMQGLHCHYPATNAVRIADGVYNSNVYMNYIHVDVMDSELTNNASPTSSYPIIYAANATETTVRMNNVFLAHPPEINVGDGIPLVNINTNAIVNFPSRPRISIFTVPGTYSWYKEDSGENLSTTDAVGGRNKVNAIFNPPAITHVEVELCGAGGGGGGGARAGAVNASGGGGGGGGMCIKKTLNAEQLSAPVTHLPTFQVVEVGAGGLGGIAAAADDTAGGAGQEGGRSRFGGKTAGDGTEFIAWGGGAGAGGQIFPITGAGGGAGGDFFATGGSALISSGGTTTLAWGNPGRDGDIAFLASPGTMNGVYQIGAGGAAGVYGNNGGHGAEANYAGPSGASGGGRTAIAGRNGGHGGRSVTCGPPINSVPAGGTTGSRNGGTLAPAYMYWNGCGGGGGFGSFDGAGGAGGAGTAGGGGGGAGVSNNGSAAAVGGNGGNGFVVIRAW